MRKPKPFFRVLTESGPLVALAVAIAILVGIAGPASAQFFNFGGWSRPAPRNNGGSWFGGDFFAPFQQQQQPKRVQDFSKAPLPDKRDPNIVAFADLLNYEAQDPTSPIDPLTYRAPDGDTCLHIAAHRGDLAGGRPPS
jgi:hypothetical protein